MARIFPKIVWSICCVVSLCMPQLARGEVSYSETDDDLTIIRMSVTPAAEPVPALKYRLAAREIDLKPGNAAPYYYRAFHELSGDMRSLRKKFDEEQELSLWYATGEDATPIADLPLEKLRKAVLRQEGSTIANLREATLRRDCDWQLGIEDVRGPELVSFRLDEFQQSREFSRMLVLQTRLAIAEQNYAAAIDSMRMNYRLAVDVAKVPFLVNGLIGTAEASMTNGTLLEMSAAPGSPNMYWALAELPDPLINLRPAARFELEFGLRMFPFIHHAETTDRSPDEWNRLYTQSVRDLATLGEGGIAQSSDLGAGFVATGNALVNYSFAKRQLVAQGMDRDKVEAMSVGQVLAVYTERNYTQFADDFEKLWYIPFPEVRERYRDVERRLGRAKPFSGSEHREVLPIVDVLLPAVNAVRTAQVRLERDMAALRVIEALRMYAASHAGGLPKSLDEITQVPVPLNPATGRPFVYRLEDRTAILELPNSDGIPTYNRRFEIKIVQPEVSADDADGRR